MLCRLFLLFIALATPALAQSVSWAGPSSVTGTVTYNVTAIAPASLTVLKNGQYFASGYGAAGSSTSDTAGQTVSYYASGMSSNNQTYYSGSTSVTITAGSAPHVPSVSVSPGTMYPGTPFTATTSVYDPDGDIEGFSIRYQGRGLIGWWPGSGSSGSGSADSTAHSTVGEIVRIRSEVVDRNGHGVAGDWLEFPVNAIPASFSFSGGSHFTYDGGSKSISVSASPSGATYSTSGTYSASDAGDYIAQANATGSYSGSGSHGWTIYPADQNSVSSQNASASAGQAFSPSYFGGSGGGAWQWYVAGQTSWSSNAWSPSSPGNYTFYVRKLGDGNYSDSNTAGGYTLSVSGIATSFSFSGGPTFTYDGNPKSVTVTASPSGATYSTTGTWSATAPDTYTATATATGNYVGSNFRTWTIQKAGQSPVTISPTTQTVNSGQSITFSAAGGSGTGSYVWGGSASGPGSTKTVSFTADGTVSVYRAGDSNYLPSNTASATITVSANGPPTIAAQPQSIEVTTGHTASFSVSASGTPAPQYEWRKNGVIISEATSPTLTLTNVLPGDAGTYQVFVYNNYGTVGSQPANLATNEPPVVLAAYDPIVVSPTQVRLRAAAIDSDGNLAQLKFYVSYPDRYTGFHLVGTASVTGGSGSGEITFDPSTTGPITQFEYNGPPTYPSGVYQVWVRAFDAKGAVDANGGEFTSFPLGSANAPTLTLSPYEIASGYVVTASFSGAPADATISLFDPHATDNAPMLPLLSTGGPSGAKTFTTNSSFSLGQVYHARMFSSSGARLTTSNGLVVVDRWGLSVVDGTGGGSYRAAGTKLDIRANLPPPGGSFVNWTLVDGPGEIGNTSEPLTTFTMGNGNAIVRANYTGIPQINSDLTASGRIEELFSYTLTASNTPTSFVAMNLPPGLSFAVLSNPTRGVISGRPTQVGSFDVQVSASNAQGTGYGLITIDVTGTSLRLQIHRPSPASP